MESKVGYLTSTRPYINKYESAYFRNKSNLFFKEEDWKKSLKEGTIDQYIDMLENSYKIDKAKFYRDYNYNYANSETRIAALYNEIYANRTNTDETRENTIIDEKGNYQTQKYTASDYDYYKQIIKEQNDLNYQKYLRQQEQERKDSQNAVVQFMADVLSVGTEVLYGFVDSIDNVTSLVGGIFNAVDAIIKGENVADAFVKSISSDDWKMFESLGLQDAIVDFESRYTNMRDLDGNYSSVGKYVGGVAYSLGLMLPALITQNYAGAAASALGATGKVASTVGKVASSLVFYGGMTADNISNTYNSMAKENVSVPSGTIIADAAIKSALQYGVEVGLSKILGGTALDKLVFGRGVSSTTSKTLTGAGAKRVLHDFVTEGLEEVFQDTSDFLVDKAFTALIKEDFGESNLSWQSLSDAFIIGGLSSFGGSALGILSSKEMELDVAKTDKDGNVKTNKRGEVVFKKLNKVAAWEYGLNMQSFIDNFNILQEQGKGLINRYDRESKQGKAYAKAFTEMYSAYRIISSVYLSIGKERFEAANNILSRVTDMINSGRFDSATLKNASSEVLTQLREIEYESSVNKERLASKIREASITEIETSAKRGEDLSDKNTDENTKKQIEDLLKIDPTLNEVYYSKDGNNIVLESGMIFIPIKYGSKVTGSTIYETVAEQTLVENIISGKYRGLPLKDITKLYKDVTGETDVTTEKAVYNLVFNDSFFKIVLSTANKDTYNFVSSLVSIIENTTPKSIKDRIYTNKISTVVEKMKRSLYDYLINQQNANYKLDIFTEEEQTKISAARWCKDLYNRVINNTSFKKLTDNDWVVLQSRVNNLPIAKTDKDTLLKNLHSESSNVRASAMNAIAKHYKGIFVTKYDGKIYMPDTTIPNRTFNIFLQERGLTIEDIINANVNNSIKSAVKQIKGDFTASTLLEFLQEEFRRTCNDKYTFRFDSKGNPGVYEYKTNKQVGYSNYNSQSASLLMPTNLENRTIVETSSKQNFLVKEIINNDVDIATASYLSIDDVITNPSLLSEQHKANIELEYGSLDIENTFLYLRKYFLEKMATTTVVSLQDGSYAFADVSPMLSLLKNDKLNINKNTKISQLIKPSFLYGRLLDTKISLTKNPILAEYDPAKNVIYINENIAERGGNLLKFAFLHEFQHAIQIENQMNIGINSNWIELKCIPVTTRKKIIDDVRKHRPELFEGISKGSNTELKIVNDFVYFSSAESTALGVDASKLVDFYPTIVINSEKGTILQFPWGTRYTLSSKSNLSLLNLASVFEVDMDETEYNKYKNIAVNIVKETSLDNSPILTSLVEQDLNKVYYDFSRILSILTDERDLVRIAEYLELKLKADYKYLKQAMMIKNLLRKSNNYFDKLSAYKDIPVDCTPSQLIDLYNKYSRDVEIDDFSVKVLNKFKELTKENETNIRFTFYLDELHNSISAIFKGVKEFDADGVTEGMYIPSSTILYNTHSIGNADAYTGEVILHEILHYICYEQLEQIDTSSIHDFMMFAMNNSLNKSEYAFTSIHEFISEFTSKDFRDVIKSVDTKVPEDLKNRLNFDFDIKSDSIYSIYEELVDKLISGNFITSYKKIYTDESTKLNLLMQTKILDDLDYTEGDIDAVINNYNVFKHKQINVSGDVFDVVVNTRTNSIVFGRKNNGDTIVITKDIINGFVVLSTSTGEVLKTFDYNFTSLKPENTNMSLSAQSEGEVKLLRNITSVVKQLRKDNKNITSTDVINKLKEDFPYVPVDILSDVVKSEYGDVKIELEELNEKLKGSVEETEVKPIKRRGFSKTRSEIQNTNANKLLKHIAKDNSVEYAIMYNSLNGNSSAVFKGDFDTIKKSDVEKYYDSEYDTLLHTHPERTVSQLSYEDILNLDKKFNFKQIGVVTETGNLQLLKLDKLTKEQFNNFKKLVEKDNYTTESFDKMYESKINYKDARKALNNSNDKLLEVIKNHTPLKRKATNEAVNNIIKSTYDKISKNMSFDKFIQLFSDSCIEFLGKKDGMIVKQQMESYFIKAFDLFTLLDTEFKSEVYTKLTSVGVNPSDVFVEEVITVPKTKNRQVSNKKAAGTNLEKFGYEGKELSEELQYFIVHGNESIDEDLWNKVKSRSIKMQDVMDYLRDSETIDDKTFKLINDSFFHNTKIHTFEELMSLVDKAPEYYAAKKILTEAGYGDLLISNTNVNLLDAFIEIINKDDKLKEKYESLKYSYYDADVPISNKYLKISFMRYFDGSMETGGYVASIARAASVYKWIITGEGSTLAAKRLEDTKARNQKDGKDLTVADTIADLKNSNALDYLLYNFSREEKIKQIIKLQAPKYMKRLLELGVSERRAKSKLAEYAAELYGLSDEKFESKYKSIIGKLSNEQIDKMFANYLITDITGLDVNKLNDDQVKKVETLAEKTFTENARTSGQIVKNIRGMIRTIKSNLRDIDKGRFLKENSDLFTDRLDIKPELIKAKIEDSNKYGYLDVSELLLLEDKVRKISKDVRSNAYKSQKNLDYKKDLERKIEKLEQEKVKLLNELADRKNTTVVTYNIKDEEITINTNKEIPYSLNKILETEFNRAGTSKIKYLIEGEQGYIRTAWSEFLEQNGEYLQSLSQSDVNEIVDFYMNSEIIPSTNKAGIYSAIQVYMLGYIIKANRQGRFILTEEQIDGLTKRMDTIVNVSARNLANWRAVRKELEPEVIILQSLSAKCGVELTKGEVKELLHVIEKGDAKQITSVKNKIYNNVRMRYKGDKRSILDKILTFEKMAMLSSPGTWIRNWISNPFVKAGNRLSEQIGSKVISLAENIFNKFKRGGQYQKFRRDGQYKIVGTKVNDKVKSFIKVNFIDNNFMNLINDGLSKYDPRQTYDTVENQSLVTLITQSISNKLFQETTFKSKIFSEPHKFILKVLSDDKYINDAAIRYFGKMLTEDNVDLSKGVNTEIINYFAEAYRLAASDYMHKPNFLSKMETLMKKELGDKAFFMYKQLFPFASTSWNWFIEGINYTPIGLIKSIRTLARLEKEISKIDLKRQKGENVVSSKFTQYLAIRTLGKGIIGSTLLLTGIFLTIAGFAGIDEEDDKFKLFANINGEKIYVDVSDVFGTQGLMLGITMVTAFKEKDPIKAIGATLDAMFDESIYSEVFNTFRYSDSFGDWLMNQPFAFLNMFVPNFLKTFASVANVYNVQYSQGILGKLDKLLTQSIPGIAYFYPKHTDIYTGERQVSYKAQFVTNLSNKLLPFKIYPYNVSKVEKEAISVGVRKIPLTGRYTINGVKYNLSSRKVDMLNEYYGALNKKDLEALMSNEKSYKVWDDAKDKYVELRYSKMTDKQKKAVIERIMNDNSLISKVYILTSFEGFKYYANDYDYSKLKKLGVKNVYRENSKNKGFVKA